MSQLEDAKLWKLSSRIAADLYKYMDDFPEEERWNLGHKLRSRTGDVVTNVAEALGSIDPRDVKWLLGKARAGLFGAKGTYKHAGTAGFLKIDPDLMVAIEQAVKECDALLEKATKDIPAWYAEMESPNAQGSKR